jgi:hypothetical protein
MKIATMLLAVSLAVGACSKEKDAAPKAAPALPSGGQAEAERDHHDQAPGERHAAASVKPGSHEDWCGEHAVPESQCTRCNPDLIPAFKATGDWCAEHGLPTSQCLKHNPDLKIVRPPKE